MTRRVQFVSNPDVLENAWNVPARPRNAYKSLNFQNNFL